MNKCPLVSIIMPAYNVEKYIVKAVQSILTQDYTHWELIIVDDKSKDATVSLIKQNFCDEPRIRLIELPENIGICGSVRNNGLRLAQGDLITFLDADDELLPESLSSRTAYLQSHESATAVYGYSYYIDVDSTAVFPKPAHLTSYSDGTLQIHSKSMPTWDNIMLGGVPHALPSLMLRKEVLNRIGLFSDDLITGEDALFYIQLFIDNFSGVRTIPQYVYVERITPSSLTKQPERFQKVLNNIPLSIEAIYALPNLPEKVLIKKSWYSARLIGLYYASVRLEMSQPNETRKVVMASRSYPFIRWQHWLLFCFPFYLRSFLPKRLDEAYSLFFQHILRPSYRLGKSLLLSTSQYSTLSSKS